MKYSEPIFPLGIGHWAALHLSLLRDALSELNLRRLLHRRG